MSSIEPNRHWGAKVKLRPGRLRALEMGSHLGTNQREGPELNNQPAGIDGEEHSLGNWSGPAAFPAREEDACAPLIKGDTFLPSAFLRYLTSPGPAFA